MYTLTLTQLDGVSLGLSTIALYLVAYAIIRRKAVITLLMYYLVGVLYGFSPVYNIMLDVSPELTFTIYSAIYLTAIIKLYHDNVGRRTLVICALMSAFCVVMIIARNDGIYNEEASTAVYSSYQLVVTLLHAALIISLVRHSEIRADFRILRQRILGVGRNISLFLPC